MNIQPENSQLLAITVFLMLFLFGIGYNWAVGEFERRKYLEGYVSLAVVAGVLVTLGGVAVIDLRAALLSLGAFAASGSPMIAGSVWRYIKARREEQQHVGQTATVAKPCESSARQQR
jgi:hypothetical protein